MLKIDFMGKRLTSFYSHLFVFILIMTVFRNPIECNEASIKIGMELSYPPFEMIDPQGNPAGISVEMAHELGKYLNKKIEIKNIPFVGLIPALKAGIIDLIISSLSITPDRLKSIDFSKPYATIGLCLLLNKNSSIQGIEDADHKGITVVVKGGTSGETYARMNLTHATVIVLDKESACVLEVVQGKAEAFIYDQLSVYTNWKKNPLTTRAILQPFQKEDWAIGIRKGNDALRIEVDRFIAEFKKENGFIELGKKFLPEQYKAFKEMGIPFIF